MDSKKIPLTVCLLIDMQSGKVDGVRCISTNEGLPYNMDPMLRMNRQWIQRGPGGTWA